MGKFGIGARRLKKLGMMSDVKKIELDGKSVPMGTFTSPLTLERFLSSLPIQYQIFKNSTLEYYNEIRETKTDSLVGTSIVGETLTLSGLIGIVSQAGIKGAKSWIANPSERERFPHTTQVFVDTNGIF